jgi:hypothetical protein
MKDLCYRFQTVDQSAISIPMGSKLLCFVPKDVENCVLAPHNSPPLPLISCFSLFTRLAT